ncbi:LAMI_0B03444g1_1 [Lachancea mirantina]|uniref:Protein YIP n=1 Tax=Lachancea mirantina TaxID=1230905 RepID=A0A1G4IUL3_9SACH|nr:LAMI_0B03444g1_1 [Lachancea mirantina]
MDEPNPFADNKVNTYGSESVPIVVPDTTAAAPKAGTAAQPQSYADHFQVTPEIVYAKMRTVVHLSVSREMFVTEPDLYGPVWITATVVAARFFTQTLTRLIISDIYGENAGGVTASMTYKQLTTSAALFFGYTVVAAAAVTLVSRRVLQTSGDLTFVGALCIYGYSNLNWIAPAAICSVLATCLASKPRIETTVVTCLLSLIAGALSGVFVFRQLGAACVEEERQPQWRSAVVVFFAVHMLFALAAGFLLF